jgi:hypothetical protein
LDIGHLGLETLRRGRCSFVVESPVEYPTPKAVGVKSRRWVVAVFLATCAAIVVTFVLLRLARPAPFVVLHGPLHFRMSLRDWVDRCIPAKVSWRWAWNLEQRLFGKRKPVLIQAWIVSFADSPPTLLTNSLGPPDFSDTNGLCVWLLSSNRVSALRGYFWQMPASSFVSGPRISTAEGIEATMNFGGTSFSCCAQFRHNSTDFLTRATVSEFVTKDNDAIDTHGYGPYGYTPPTITIPQTNLDVALRLQLPKENGFFLLDQSRHEPPSKNIGVLIDPL